MFHTFNRSTLSRRGYFEAQKDPALARSKAGALHALNRIGKVGHADNRRCFEFYTRAVVSAGRSGQCGRVPRLVGQQLRHWLSRARFELFAPLVSLLSRRLFVTADLVLDCRRRSTELTSTLFVRVLGFRE